MSDARVVELLDKVGEVCPIAAAATRVISLIDDPRSNINSVASAVAVDPALAAETMRIANSAAFGAGRVRDLEHAVSLLGLSELRDMAAAMAMLAAFRSETELGPQLHEVSVLTGALARRVAKDLQGVNRSEAFLCGLLSEVGAMACLAVDGEGFMNLWHACDGEPIARAQLERELYGACSFEVGGRLLKRNNLPADVADAVGTSNDSDATQWSMLARVTVFARTAAPKVVAAIREDTLKDLPLILAQAGAACGLPSTPEQLLQAAIDAGMTAEQALRKSA
jgi:HD-like signal output (HDOD) protein